MLTIEKIMKCEDYKEIISNINFNNLDLFYILYKNKDRSKTLFQIYELVFIKETSTEKTTY